MKLGRQRKGHGHLAYCLKSVLVGAFNQEKDLFSRGLLRDCKTSHNLREGSLEALLETETATEVGGGPLLVCGRETGDV